MGSVRGKLHPTDRIFGQAEWRAVCAERLLSGCTGRLINPAENFAGGKVQSELEGDRVHADV